MICEICNREFDIDHMTMSKSPNVFKTMTTNVMNSDTDGEELHYFCLDCAKEADKQALINVGKGHFDNYIMHLVYVGHKAESFPMKNLPVVIINGAGNLMLTVYDYRYSMGNKHSKRLDLWCKFQEYYFHGVQIGEGLVHFRKLIRKRRRNK